jgi:hypothetical protein
MSTSASASAQGRTGAGDSRLHLVSALDEKKERNRLWSLLANGALSLRRRLRLAGEAARRSGLVRRVATWWARIRGWFKPVLKAARVAGVALPLWLPTNGRVQQQLGVGLNKVGQASREGLYLSSDLVTWLLWRLGGFGQDIARQYGFLVERVERLAETVVGLVARGLRFVQAEQVYVRVVHDLAGAMVIVRGIATIYGTAVLTQR